MLFFFAWLLTLLQIMHGAANIRSAVKDKIRFWIASSYGFREIQQLDGSANNENTQANDGKKLANKELYVLLTQDRNYTYAKFDREVCLFL